jgi:hypothetical protein
MPCKIILNINNIDFVDMDSLFCAQLTNHDWIETFIVGLHLSGKFFSREFSFRFPSSRNFFDWILEQVYSSLALISEEQTLNTFFSWTLCRIFSTTKELLLRRNYLLSKQSILRKKWDERSKTWLWKKSLS